MGFPFFNFVDIKIHKGFEVRGFYQINNPAIVEAGKAVDRLTPPDALVVAPYGGDTAFLYQTNRRGWPIGGLIDQRIQQGADYYVTTTLDDEAKTLMAKYRVVESAQNYTLIDLNQMIEAPKLSQPIVPTAPLKNLTPLLIISPTPSTIPSSTPTDLPRGLKKKLK